jgi:RNA polymerase sigma factor (sigma-70 family)
MSAGISSALRADFTSLFRDGVQSGLTDAQLLEQFLTRRGEGGEAAFTALVERHGPMVLRVCGDVLGDGADAEDAFQATFLALVRSGGSIRKRDSVQSWLFGVARRIAVLARHDAARARRRERDAASRVQLVREDEPLEELRSVLSDELARLPEKYREPVLLCDMEGLSYDQAARRIGCPTGTVGVRLMRARQRLRGRLVRRGIGLSVAAIGESVASLKALAEVPPALVHAVVHAAATRSPGWREVLASLEAGLSIGPSVGRRAIPALILLAGASVASIALALAIARDTPAGRGQAVSPITQQVVPSQAASPGTVDFRVEDRTTRRPLAGVTLELQVDGRRASASVTDESGRHVLVLPRSDPESVAVVARKPGYAPMQVILRGDSMPDRTIPAAYSLALSPPLPIGGVVRDESGRPVEGVAIDVFQWARGVGRELLATEGLAVKTDAQGRWRADVIPDGFDPGRLQLSFSHAAFMTQYETFLPVGGLLPGPLRDLKALTVIRKGVAVHGRVLDQGGRPVSGAVILVDQVRGPMRRNLKADADGRFRADGLEPRTTQFVIQAAGHASMVETLDVRPGQPPVEFRLKPARPLRGRVVDAAGKLAARATVVGALASDWQAFQWHNKTDAEGRFQWDEAPYEDVSLFAASSSSKETASLKVAPTNEEVLLTLAPVRSLRIRGTVVDDATGRPIPEFTVVPSVEGGREIVTLQYARSFIQGRYEIAPSLGNDVHRIRIEARGYLRSYSPYYRRDSGEQVFDARLTRGEWVEGIVRGAEDSPLAGAEVVLVEGAGLSIRDGRVYQGEGHPHLVTGKDGQFSFSPPPGSFRLVALHDSGYSEVEGKPSQSRYELTVVAWGRVEGTLRVGGKTLAAEAIQASMGESWTHPETPNVSHDHDARTDEKGHFVIDRIPAGEAMVHWQPSEVTRLSPPTRIYRSSFVEVVPGRTSRLDIIQEGGRALVGRLSAPGDVEPDLANAEWHAYIVVKRPDPPYPAGLGELERAKWLRRWKQTEEGKRYRHAERDFGYTVVIQDDRSFRVDEIQPGRYVLEVRVRGSSRENRGELARLTREFAVAPAGPQSSGPVDLGTLVLERVVP